MKYEITVPQGYRKVGEDEIIQREDVLTNEPIWRPVCGSVGAKPRHYPGYLFIRKVSPDLDMHPCGYPLIPAGYRPLGPKEVLESRDFFWTPGALSWASVTAYGRPACDATFNVDTLYIRPR
jgi:hypothetical protein